MMPCCVYCDNSFFFVGPLAFFCCHVYIHHCLCCLLLESITFVRSFISFVRLLCTFVINIYIYICMCLCVCVYAFANPTHLRPSFVRLSLCRAGGWTIGSTGTCCTTACSTIPPRASATHYNLLCMHPSHLTNRKQNGPQATSAFEMWFCYRIPAPLVTKGMLASKPNHTSSSYMIKKWPCCLIFLGATVTSSGTRPPARSNRRYSTPSDLMLTLCRLC